MRLTRIRIHGHNCLRTSVNGAEPVKPAPFRYLAPSTVPEALGLLAALGADARPLAGGQSLVPMMNFRLAHPAALIDLNRIPDLAYIRDAGDHLAIGAMTRERQIERSDLVRSAAPLLHKATLNIAHAPIRSRGTIGGSIANADPAAEYPAAMLALDGEMVLRNARRERVVPARDFFQGVLTTAIEPGELLVEIRVPKAPPRAGTAFLEISRRHGDFALVGVAAQVVLEGTRIGRVQLAACGVGAVARRLEKGEAAVRGQEPDAAVLAAAGKAASAEIEPQADLHAGADYRRKLAGVLVKRALTEAIADARRSA